MNLGDSKHQEQTLTLGERYHLTTVKEMENNLSERERARVQICGLSDVKSKPDDILSFIRQERFQLQVKMC